jgi:predicted aldo/keto reductase-like oxidoreductase
MNKMKWKWMNKEKRKKREEEIEKIIKRFVDGGLDYLFDPKTGYREDEKEEILEKIGYAIEQNTKREHVNLELNRLEKELSQTQAGKPT